MMPIFFNLESHLWIGYLFVINGLLLNYVLSIHSPVYSRLTKPFEAKVLFGFGIALCVNMLLAGALAMAQINWSQAVYPLGLISLIAIGYVSVKRDKVEFVGEIGLSRVGLYVVVAAVIFINGGLIETLSDAWWHMALANKISLADSVAIESGALNGVEHRWYPPLWHANLAFLKDVSGESITVLWNSATVWIAVFKVASVYLFASALTARSSIGLLSAILFVLIPGVGVSYLRVSAWPSHVAYTFMFLALYLLFRLMDELEVEQQSSVKNGVVTLLTTQKAYVALLACVLLIVLFTHQLEVLWVILSFVFFMFAWHLRNGFSPTLVYRLPADFVLFDWLFKFFLISLFGLSLWGVFAKLDLSDANVDRTLAHIGVAWLLLLLFASTFLKNGAIKHVIYFLIVLMLALSIDFRHVVSLFIESFELPRGRYPQSPLSSTGWFGGELVAPGWHLQLRSGLVYSGILAVIASVVLAISRPNRATLFLVGNAWLSFLVCCSPYLYQWLTDITGYHSIWRIATLIFTPVILAYVLHELWAIVFKHDRVQK